MTHRPLPLTALFVVAATLGLFTLTARSQVLTSNYTSSTLASFASDGSGGSVLLSAASGGLDQPHRSRILPDGSLVVASAGTNNLLRFDFATGGYLGEFVTSAGDLDYPVDLTLRPDGFLYVSSQGGNEILRFDSTTGVRDLTWAASDLSLQAPSGIVFDPVGNLYVSGRSSGNVVQFAPDGTFLRSFGSLTSAFGIAFGPDGALLVASGGTGTIERFDNLAGAPIQTTWTSGLSTPVGIEPLGDGTYLVAEFGSSTITRFGSNGTSLGTFASGPLLLGPNFITVVPEPSTSGLLLATALLALLLLRRRAGSTRPANF